MNRILLILAIVLFLLAPLAARADNGVIGTIMEVEGTATRTIGGSSAPLKLNDTIGENDVITTGLKSRLFILFIDDTQLTMGENSRFKATDFDFDDKDTTNNHARYSFLSGTFNYMSGLMTKKTNPDVKIDTVFGSIGVRGTRLWAGDAGDGYGVHVDEGVVDVANTGGTVTVKAGQGTDLHSRRIAPTRAAGWTRERRQRMQKTVALRDEGLVGRRVAQQSARQQDLRDKYRTLMERRHGKGVNGKAGNGAAVSPEKQELRQEKLQERLQKRRRFLNP
ncbi:MAG: FecR domain-containing protein [Micavibrio sp.]|nr:FecR domain-containing protein [Micavibrio sp.]